jgi:23S rRNA (cytidine1920-2'-O)/16S rRNA (cytidine1409-2'-O)-methyltransferase
MAAKEARRKAKHQRADTLLMHQGLAESKAKAQALILAGRVYAGGQRVEKPGSPLLQEMELRVTEGARYVSRGGEKMAGALRDFGLNVNGLTALDLGASTGGFTDCLLQHGVARVYAIDVGYGQLANTLRQEPRVISMERTNARNPLSLPEATGVIVADVSFISLRLVLPPALEHLTPGGHVIALVKPQFEAGKSKVGRRGVVRDPKVHAQVVGSFCLWAISRGLRLLGVRSSVLEGDTGNREFFALLQKPA